MNFKSRSNVWNFYKYEEDAIKVKCNLCSSFISRGGTGKKASTSPLLNHLKRKHFAEYSKINPHKEIEKDQELASDSTNIEDDPSISCKRRKMEQPTLQEVLEKKKVWDINNPKAVELHYAIGQMIAVDNQPYLFVEDEGFRNLMSKAQPQYKVTSREYFKQTIIPKMYSNSAEKVKSMICLSTYISLTTDIWTNSGNKDSFISFTAHWIDNDFNYTHIVLNSRHFPGSHTGEDVSRMLTTMSEEWGVTNKIYLVIRDGGSNIVKAVNDLKLENESCFLHNLHLIVGHALNSQRAIKDIIAIGRKIVGHFNHSSSACSRFKEIQEKQLHMQYKKVVQDVTTRWNSTFYMLSRLLELKNAISLYINENDIQNFSSYQWTLMENCIKLLKPFEDITKQISTSKSLISEVIPMVVTLRRYLLKSTEVSGVGTMKETLQKNIHERFSTIQLNKHYSFATVLDPRFKMLFFDKDEECDNGEVVKSLLLSLMEEESEISKVSEDMNGSSSQFLNSEDSEVIKTQDQASFWDVFTEITSNKITENEKESTTVQELNEYLSQPVIARKASPFSWWKANETNFPILSKLVKKYLSPPASSIYSERLFSEAGIIYEQRRNRILPKNAEQLLFLHHNVPILKNIENS